MASVEEWKRRLVGHFGIYGKQSVGPRVICMDELRWQFGSNFDINAQAAYDDLSNSGIIRAVTIGGERFYVLDVEGKYKEIM